MPRRFDNDKYQLRRKELTNANIMSTSGIEIHSSPAVGIRSGFSGSSEHALAILPARANSDRAFGLPCPTLLRSVPLPFRNLFLFAK